jgi:hypothetical protein
MSTHARARTHKFAMSALPPKADIGGVSSDVRFVPEGDLSRCSNGGAEPGLFDYLVGRHLHDKGHR